MAVMGWKNGTSVYALTFKGPLNAKNQGGRAISLDGLNNGASVQFAANRLFWSGPDLDEQAEIKDSAPGSSRPRPATTRTWPGADRRRMGELLHLNDIPWYLGVSGGVSVTYKFLNTELKDDSQKKTDYSFAAQAGVFRPSIGFLIGTIGFQQTSAAGGDSVSVCRSLPETDATTCVDALLKPPTQTRGALATAQIRRKVAGDVAIAPTLQYDIEKEVTAVIIPVYFLKDANGSPIGGIRAGWRSDTEAVVISLFVALLSG